jgi:hypothetical protein
MKWKIEHTDIKAINSEIHSKSKIMLEHEGISIELISCKEPELHHLGARRVLVDAANKLRKIAHEMENKAEKTY